MTVNSVIDKKNVKLIKKKKLGKNYTITQPVLEADQLSILGGQFWTFYKLEKTSEIQKGIQLSQKSANQKIALKSKPEGNRDQS